MCRARQRRLTRPMVSGHWWAALKLGAVIKLGVVGQPIALPASQELFDHGLGAGLLHRPGIHQAPMQAGGGEHRDQRTAGDLQILNEVQAIELRPEPWSDRADTIPCEGAGRRCRPAPLSSPWRSSTRLILAIEGKVPAPSACRASRIACAPYSPRMLERRTARSCTTRCSMLASISVPSGLAARHPVTEVHSVKSLASRARHPIVHLAHADPMLDSPPISCSRPLGLRAPSLVAVFPHFFAHELAIKKASNLPHSLFNDR